MRRNLYTIGLFALLAVTACGGGGNSDDDILKGGADGGSSAGGGSGPALTATLKGKVSFEGTAPTPKKIQTSADPGCKNPGLESEETVVSDGGLENVIIYVSGGDTVGKNFPAPKEAVTLTQEGCHYIPHAISLQVGQPLKIVNGDDTAHNVHAWAEKNSPFNESQASKGLETTKVFDKEEVLLPIRCDVHNWMNAFVAVVTNPMHTVSKKGGAFEMKMAPGKYEVTAIHEKYGKKTQMIEVTDNGSVELNFSFKADDKAAD